MDTDGTALLSAAEGLRANSIGVSSGKVISCTFLSKDTIKQMG